jgi:hypothetical protein
MLAGTNTDTIKLPGRIVPGVGFENFWLANFIVFRTVTLYPMGSSILNTRYYPQSRSQSSTPPRLQTEIFVNMCTPELIISRTVSLTCTGKWF